MCAWQFDSYTIGILSVCKDSGDLSWIRLMPLADVASLRTFFGELREVLPDDESTSRLQEELQEAAGPLSGGSNHESSETGASLNFSFSHIAMEPGVVQTKPLAGGIVPACEKPEFRGASVSNDSWLTGLTARTK